MTPGEPGPGPRSPRRRKGQERATLRGHADTVRSLAFLDGGKALATRAEDGSSRSGTSAEAASG